MASATTVSSSSELAEAIPSGGTIEIEPGNYYLTRTTYKRSDTYLVPTDVDHKPTVFMSAKHPAAPMLSASGLSGIGWENITLDGNFANQPGAVRGSSSLILCALQGCSDIHMSGCNVQNSAIDALTLRGCHDVLVENNTVHDLGHEFVYALSCYGGEFRGNNVKTRTNSAFRLSYGASGFDIHDNKIWSWLDKASTGPGIELDKGNFKEINIEKNDFSILNGSGIWAMGNGGSCNNVVIHDNTFDTVGQYYTTSGVYSAKYNGYSNACLAGAGFDGLVFENNEINNVKYGVIMNEWKYTSGLSGTRYAWIFRNNTLKNAGVGFRIDNARGSISGSGNTLENVKTFSVGVKGNVKVSTDKPIDPIPKPDPDPIIIPVIPNVGDDKIGQFKCTVNLIAEDGRKYNTTATANVTSIKATGTGKKISGYFRLKDMDTQEELHVPFEGTLEKGLF